MFLLNHTFCTTNQVYSCLNFLVQKCTTRQMVELNYMSTTMMIINVLIIIHMVEVNVLQTFVKKKTVE